MNTNSIVFVAISFGAAGLCTAGPPVVCDGYEAFYESLYRPVFRSANQHKFLTDISPSGRMRPFWAGDLAENGAHHVVELAGTDVIIDGRRLAAAKARNFEKETPADLGEQATLYINEHYVCVEGIPPSASGTAVRHTNVTVVTKPYSPAAVRYELPSLFASCLGLQDGEPDKPIRFFRARYRYDAGHDMPDGVVLDEFLLQSGAFRATERRTNLTFTDPDNVYRFQIAPADR